MTTDKTFTAFNLSIHQLINGDFQSEIATLQLFIKHLPEMEIPGEDIIPTLADSYLSQPFNTKEKNLRWLAFRANEIICILETLHHQSTKIEHAVLQVEAGIPPGHTLEIQQLDTTTGESQ